MYEQQETLSCFDREERVASERSRPSKVNDPLPRERGLKVCACCIGASLLHEYVSVGESHSCIEFKGVAQQRTNLIENPGGLQKLSP